MFTYANQNGTTTHTKPIHRQTSKNKTLISLDTDLGFPHLNARLSTTVAVAPVRVLMAMKWGRNRKQNNTRPTCVFGLSYVSWSGTHVWHLAFSMKMMKSVHRKVTFAVAKWVALPMIYKWIDATDAQQIKLLVVIINIWMLINS